MELAELAAKERDLERLMALAAEIDQLLGEQDRHSTQDADAIKQRTIGKEAQN